MDGALIQRENQVLALFRYLKRFSAVSLVGARQVGKSTIAQTLASRFQGPTAFFDLSDVKDRYQLAQPERELSRATGLVVLDEAQRHPRLFSALPVLLEANRGKARFLIIGGSLVHFPQASLEDLSESLAVHELPPLSLHEVGAEQYRRLWLRGGLPRSFGAKSDADSFKWRGQLSLDIVEEDPFRPGPPISSGPMRNFLLSLIHYHSKLMDVVELARSFGVRISTVERYLDVLRESYVIRMLQPFRSGRTAGEIPLPKLVFCDTGILHNLLGIETLDALEAHPKAPLSWKAFAMDSVIRRIRAGVDECHHWSLRSQQGVDLLVVRDDFRWGFEFQYLDRAYVTSSMKLAQKELKLDRFDVIHRSEGPGMLEGGIPLHTLESLPESLRLPDGFERRPEFLEMEKEAAEELR